jgi:hypothetical protein
MLVDYAEILSQVCLTSYLNHSSNKARNELQNQDRTVLASDLSLAVPHTIHLDLHGQISVSHSSLMVIIVQAHLDTLHTHSIISTFPDSCHTLTNKQENLQKSSPIRITKLSNYTIFYTKNSYLSLLPRPNTQIQYPRSQQWYLSKPTQTPTTHRFTTPHHTYPAFTSHPIQTLATHTQPTTVLTLRTHANHPAQIQTINRQNAAKHPTSTYSRRI